MEFKHLLSISGKPGLYKMVKQTAKGMIVESLEDGKKIPVFLHDQISSLEEISIYTYDDDESLRNVLKSIRAKNDSSEHIEDRKIADKDLKDYFREILSQYDEERVYVSHIRKIIRWYNMLLKYDLLPLLDVETAQKDEATEEDLSEETTVEQPLGDIASENKDSE